MAVKNKVTESVAPHTQRLSSSERRAAVLAAGQTKQAELKQEAADRRAKRAAEAPGPSGRR